MTALADRGTASVAGDGAGHPLDRLAHGRRLRALAVVLAPVAAAVMLIAAFGVATVHNASMEPTLRSGDTVVYDRWSSPGRGDVVLLVDRQGWSGATDTVLVKRIVGIEGDVVVCCEAGTGRLIVNDEPIDEPFVDGARPGGSIPFRITVPDGAVWVMGDNREASADSRAAVSAPGHGAVPRSDLRGTVRARWTG